MNVNEFQDLQKFGNNIDKIPEDLIKKKPIKKNNLVYFFKYLFKILIHSVIKIKNWLIFKKDFMIIRRNFKFKNTKKGYSYKIVETKKQRGNKTIIIRKRVPFLNINNYKYNLNNINGMFYLSEKDRNTKDSEHYFFVKKSVWDFPIDDKKFRYFSFFWRK